MHGFVCDIIPGSCTAEYVENHEVGVNCAGQGYEHSKQIQVSLELRCGEYYATDGNPLTRKKRKKAKKLSRFHQYTQSCPSVSLRFSLLDCKRSKRANSVRCVRVTKIMCRCSIVVSVLTFLCYWCEYTKMVPRPEHT